ncbi:MAG TPA: hypothetical protein PLY34_05005 [Ferruginibacter sp.]|nr:hypothetical protein [Ferruginibacter sp.]HPH91174.1 hypothetical protein [Ferruginibacter sp.]
MADVQQLSPTPLKKASGFKKILRWLVFLSAVVFVIWIWWNFYNVFGEGVKSGELNYVVKKGNVFKTFEGKLIQSGIRSKTAGSIASYEFEFSIENDSLANYLMNNSGKYFDLHYKEFRGAIPWRGYSKYVVDKVIAMKDVER